MTPPENKAELIRQIFVELGGRRSVPAVTAIVLERNVYTVDELKAKAYRAIRDDVRRALGVETASGVPFAQPLATDTSEDAEDDRAPAPTWAQLDLFTLDEFNELLDRRTKEVQDDHQKLARLRQWGVNRWGPRRVHRIPQMEMPLGGR